MYTRILDGLPEKNICEECKHYDPKEKYCAIRDRYLDGKSRTCEEFEKAKKKAVKR